MEEILENHVLKILNSIPKSDKINLSDSETFVSSLVDSVLDSYYGSSKQATDERDMLFTGISSMLCRVGAEYIIRNVKKKDGKFELKRGRKVK